VDSIFHSPSFLSHFAFGPFVARLLSVFRLSSENMWVSCFEAPSALVLLQAFSPRPAIFVQLTSFWL
jgi:hypothetical protein